MTKYIGYAGTYTRESSQGIYKFILDVERQKLEKVEVAAKVGSPTYLAITEDQKSLYSVAQDGETGGVAAYTIDQATGDLEKINQVLTEGAPPCHLETYEGTLVTGNYHLGTVELHDISNGEVRDASSVSKHEGSGPHERQEKPHVHYTARTPDGRYVVVADLGTDELTTYEVRNNELVKAQTLKVKAGSGPRHVAFHPSKPVAYLLTELSSEVVVLDYDATDGSFTEKQYISALPEDYKGENDASAIHVSSDGKFVYAGNRGHNSIAVYQVNEETGELTWIENTLTGGEWPRDFVLDPSEKFLIASNQHTGNLVLFARDEETGKLTKLDSEVPVPEVVCVKFLV